MACESGLSTAGAFPITVSGAQVPDGSTTMKVEDKVEQAVQQAALEPEQEDEGMGGMAM